ncbi:MAG: signal recognition particle protein, partial [Solirubrobacterales bacterium]
NVAQQFSETANFDGVIMTKLDGDARGGAALSIKAVTGKPIMYASVGEKLDQFEVFHADRMADRILGMGDVMTLIEKAEREIDEDQALEMERKMRKNEFTFDDFLDQMKMMRKMGSLSSILGMMPGIDKKALKNVNIDERELDRIQAIVLSMTPKERNNPKIINGKRRKRIAAGSGTSVQQVNKLIKQFAEMKKMMKRMTSKGGKGMPDISQMLGGR